MTRSHHPGQPSAWLDEAWRQRPEWLDRGLRPPERHWLIESSPEGRGAPLPVLPRGTTALLTGDGPETSTALLELAICVAEGTPGALTDAGWLGGALRLARRDGRVDEGACGAVAVILGEEDAHEAHWRLWHLAEDRGLSTEARARLAERLVIVPAAGQRLTLVDNGEPAPFLAELRRRLEGPPAPEGWALVALDPLSRFTGADAARTVEVLESLRGVPGRPTVLATHRVPQDARPRRDGAATFARGVTALADGVRWVGRLAEQDEEVCFAVVKTEEPAPRPAEMRLVRTPKGLRSKHAYRDDRGLR